MVSSLFIDLFLFSLHSSSLFLRLLYSREDRNFVQNTLLILKFSILVHNHSSTSLRFRVGNDYPICNQIGQTSWQTITGL